jgi:glycosyltransferase involved in cell wall biosynthesis
MKMTPLISVVVPTYNYGSFLFRALNSVVNQGNLGVELIVVDDGSTDDTSSRMADYLKDHPGLKYIWQENAGAARARNVGIAQARGKYVLLLDADDELMSDALVHLEAAISDYPEAAIFLGGHVSVFPDGREKIHKPSVIKSSRAVEIARDYLLRKKITMSHCCTLFLRELLVQRPYPESLQKGEDIPVFAYLLTAGKQIVSIPHELAKIHKHADSLRHKKLGKEAPVDLMVGEVFSYLPRECQLLRNRYKAQRLMALGRQALNNGDSDSARHFYYQGIRISPQQIMNGSHLRKFLRALCIR